MLLDNLRTRLNYRGSANQQDRMIQDKVWSLSKALLYSYQACTVDIDGKQFRALMNPDKLKPEYDHKIISIQFKDVCLNAPRVGKTSEGKIDTGMKPGKSFLWVENNTWWICWLQHLEEKAYFRGDVFLCEYEVEINGNLYHVYMKGPDQESLEWHTKTKQYWNEMNYMKVMFIEKNDETVEFFKRFQVVKINGEPWRVEASNDIYGDGIIRVYLHEFEKNSIAEAAQEEKASKAEQEEQLPPPSIEGDDTIYPYEVHEFTSSLVPDAKWTLSACSKGMQVKFRGETTYNSEGVAALQLEVLSGKSGWFELSYSSATRRINVGSL